MDTPQAYHAIRERVADLVSDLTDAQEARVVPACPDWTVHDLVSHMALMPAALAAGDFPTGDIQAWIDRIVADGRAVAIDEQLAAWAASADALAGVLSSGPLLAIDLLIHEHDLRGAIDHPGARDSEELMFLLPHVLESLSPALIEAGLGAIEVRSGAGTWRSHDASVGWTLGVGPWEATRALESRRTADELRALPGSGDPEPFVTVLDSHLPLPTASLGEPIG